MEAEIRVTIPDLDENFMGAGTDLDLQRVEVYVYEDFGPALGLWNQPNPGESYATPEFVTYLNPPDPPPPSVPYQVFPPYLDFVQRTLQYNYEDKQSCNEPAESQDCTDLPFDVFRNNGANESPYADTSVLIDPNFPPGSFPTSYNSTTAEYHLERTTSTSNSVGEFNGTLVAPEDLPNAQDEYELTVKFTRLRGPQDPDSMCVQALAVDARGWHSAWVFEGAACDERISCGTCHPPFPGSSAVLTPRSEPGWSGVPSEHLLRSHLTFLDAELGGSQGGER